MIEDRPSRNPEGYVLTTPAGRLLLRAIDPALNNSAGRRQVRSEILSFCQTYEGYSVFSGLVRDQLTDDFGERRESIKNRIRPIERLLAGEFGDPQHAENTRLFFVFEQHATEKREKDDVKERYKAMMRRAFSVGERNILALESPHIEDVVPTGIVYPERATEFEISVQARGSNGREINEGGVVHSVEFWTSHIKRLLREGNDMELNYGISVMQAVDELNAEGYEIGLMYEEGLSMDQTTDRITGGVLSVGLEEYKDATRKFMAHMANVDKKFVSQILSYVESEEACLTNVFVPRGTFHSTSTLKSIPYAYIPSLRESASITTGAAGETPVARMYKILLSGKEPTEVQWRAAHRDNTPIVRQ